MTESTIMGQRKEKLKTALMTLAIELELKEGRRFNIIRGVEEVSKVLKFSLISEDIDVLTYLHRVIELLSDEQIKFFVKKGIELDLNALDQRLALDKHNSKQEVLYRGHATSPSEAAGSSESEEHKGKRKIVYRGQVKWV